MSVKLYGVVRSRATRPLWVFLETGLPFDQVPVIQASRLPDPQAQGAPLNTASAAFLAVNPMGQVPTLVDGDLVLTESLVCALHVARKGGAPVGPADAVEDALMQNWAFFIAASVEPGAMDILYPLMDGISTTPEGQARMARGADALARPLARIEAHLSTQDWLVGGRFTVADICLAEVLRYAQGHPPALAPFEAVRGWLARCQARPAFVEMMKRRAAEPA
jgi:glutathione S-transferase